MQEKKRKTKRLFDRRGTVIFFACPMFSEQPNTRMFILFWFLESGDWIELRQMVELGSVKWMFPFLGSLTMKNWNYELYLYFIWGFFPHFLGNQMEFILIDTFRVWSPRKSMSYQVTLWKDDLSSWLKPKKFKDGLSNEPWNFNI